MVSRWSIWPRIVTQDITLIQAQLVPVLVKAPRDVLAVAGSWDDPPVQGTFVCGMSSWSQVCGMSFVFRIKFVWDVSASQGCGMTGSVALVWDVARVQHEVVVGCHERLTSVGCPSITPFDWRLRGQDFR